MFKSILKWTPPWLPLEAPWFAWLGAALILIAFVYYYFKLLIKCWREESLTLRIIRDIGDYRSNNLLRPAEGFSGEQLEAFEKIFTPHTRYKEAWENFRSQIIRLTTRENVDTFWASETSSEYFSEDPEPDSGQLLHP